jgi:hypothetical protein
MIATRFCPQGVGMIATRFCPQGVGGRLADDLPGTGSQSDGRGVPDLARAPDLTAATQQIVGKPASHALRAEATKRSRHSALLQPLLLIAHTLSVVTPPRMLCVRCG